MKRFKHSRGEEKDTSRISITAHHTGYTWFANGLSHPAFATLPGAALYHFSRPFMFIGREALGLADLETSLLQRHLVIDHRLERAVEEHGVTQVLELACGLSPRGFRFQERFKGRGIRYVEADLPGMAARKKHLLQQNGLLGEDHRVVEVDILRERGNQSLSAVAEANLDPSRPTAVITEGLVNYFPLKPMQNLWARISGLLASRSGGLYLSDNMPRPEGPVLNAFLRGFVLVNAAVARGGIHTHFASREEGVSALKGLGFDRAGIFSPEDLKGRVPGLVLTRQPSFLHVMEAWADAGAGGGKPGE